MKEKKKDEFKDYIATVENYPKEGITFRDINPLMADGMLIASLFVEIVQYATDKKIDMIEVLKLVDLSWVVQLLLSWELVLPLFVSRVNYHVKLFLLTMKKEYGVDTLTMHADAIKPGQRVLIVDDLLATGGTVKATIEMIEETWRCCGGCAFLVGLDELNGREKNR